MGLSLLRRNERGHLSHLFTIFSHSTAKAPRGMGALHMARSPLPFTTKKIWGYHLLLGASAGDLFSPSNTRRAEAAYQCMRRLHITFLPGGDGWLFFSFSISRHFVYLSPLFLYCDEKATTEMKRRQKTMKIRRKCGTGAGVFGGTSVHMEWGFIHGEGGEGWGAA